MILFALRACMALAVGAMLRRLYVHMREFTRYSRRLGAPPTNPAPWADYARLNIESAMRSDARLYAYGHSAFWLDPDRYGPSVPWDKWLLVQPDPHWRDNDPTYLGYLNRGIGLQHPFARNYAAQRAAHAAHMAQLNVSIDDMAAMLRAGPLGGRDA